MLANKMNLRTEIERYEDLRKQCDELIYDTRRNNSDVVYEGFVHAFREVCVKQIDTLKRAVAIVK